MINMDNVKDIKLKGINEHGDQDYDIITEDATVNATAMITKEFDVVIKCDVDICQEVEDQIYIKALDVWRKRLNERV